MVLRHGTAKRNPEARSEFRNCSTESEIMSSTRTSVDKADRRTLGDAHLDIGLGNNYRLEYVKHLVSIATGIFVFSVTFMKDLIGEPSQASLKVFLISGWSALAVSIVSGVFHMRLWGAYYISWGLHYDAPHAEEYRKSINRRRKIAEWLQICGFAAGLLLLLAFAAWNLIR